MAKFLSDKDVTKRTTLSAQSINFYAQRGEFPPPVNILGLRNVWVESEIESWIRMKIAGKDDDEVKKEIERMVKARKD